MRRGRCALVVGGVEREVRCGRVVVCAGAVETPRLLLVSGLGGPAVGTNLHNHSFTILYGTAREPLERFQGPGHSVATLDFVHRDGEAWGGGVLFDAPSLLPVAAAAAAGRLGFPAWGAGPQGVDARRGCRTSCGGMGIGQEIPSAHARSRPTRRSRDVHGMPVARIAGDVHPATLEVRAYMAERVARWLDEVGIERCTDFTTGRPGRRRRALGGHVPDGGGPGDVGVRPRRAAARRRRTSTSPTPRCCPPTAASTRA